MAAPLAHRTPIAALLATVDGGGLAARRDRTLPILGLFAGLRTGELHRLRWRDLHVEGGTLELIGKAAKPATVAMAPQLHGWREVMIASAAFDPDWPVVPALSAPNGSADDVQVRQPLQPLSLEGIRLVVHGHRDQIGVAYLRPHDLRRTLAGILDARGVRIEDIRLILRHETIDATHRYLRDNPLRAQRRLRAFTVAL